MKTAQRRLDILREDLRGREEYGDDDLRWENFLEAEEARPRQTVARCNPSQLEQRCAKRQLAPGAAQWPLFQDLQKMRVFISPAASEKLSRLPQAVAFDA